MIGAEADRLDHPGRIEQPGLGRAAGRLQQAGPRVGGGRDPVGGQAELGGQPGILPAYLIGFDSHLARLGGVPGGRRVVPRAGRGLALLEGVPGQPDGQHDQHAERRDEAAQPDRAVPFRGLLESFRRGPRVHERPGQRAQTVPVDRVGGPVPGQRQLAAPEQGRRILPGLVPGPCGLAEPPPDPQALPVGVDPGAQQRPGGEQGLVGDLRGVRVHRNQPFRDEPVEHLLGGRGFTRPVPQLVQPHRAARLRRVVGHVHQPQEEPPGHVLLLFIERLVDLVGRPRDRVPDAPAGLVVRHGEPAPVPARPGGEEGMGQQRQCAGLMPGPGQGDVGRSRREVAEQQFDQAVRDIQPRQAGRFDDRGADLLPGHRHDHDLALLERARPVPGSAAPDRRSRPAGRAPRRPAGQRANCRDEAMPLLLVLAGGEDLLELVHHDDQPRSARSRG